MAKVNQENQKRSKPVKHPDLPEGWWHQRLKLSHRKHTARRLPHKHSSLGLLVLLLLIVGGFLLFMSSQVVAESAPDSNSVEISGTMPAVPAQRAAVILRPKTGQSVATATLKVKGTCEPSYMIMINRNDVLAGSTLCNSSRLFSLSISLLKGENKLVAKTKDSLDQFGPDSTATLVTYTPDASSLTVSSLLAPPIYLTADSTPQLIGTGRQVGMKLRIAGGKSPYALLVKWGETDQEELIALSGASEVDLQHDYEKGGIFSIVSYLSDGARTKSFLQSTVITPVDKNAKPTSSGGESVVNFGSYVGKSYLTILWPLYILIVAMASAFWLGERFFFYKSRYQLKHKN